METVLIVIHLMLVVALVGVILLQRSEGGGLGIGGGNSGGLMTARGAASALTRVTGFLALGFFITSLALGILARQNDPTAGRFQDSGTIESSGEGILDALGPATTAPETPAANEIPGSDNSSNNSSSVPTGN